MLVLSCSRLVREPTPLVARGSLQVLYRAERVFFGDVVDFDDGHGELVQYKKASLGAFDQKLEVG
ncbi:hypothetical protein NTGBS_720025 [Candidatus Nitrotoga sp. BS]|nr:hypothetical protein NTGBS_720025 [Candidatus Nitrotoga sp. BS]